MLLAPRCRDVNNAGAAGGGRTACMPFGGRGVRNATLPRWKVAEMLLTTWGALFDIAIQWTRTRAPPPTSLSSS
jgi:hypothetical protein